MTTPFATPSVAQESRGDAVALHDRMGGAACQAIARTTFGRRLLASLLCSTALLTGSGAAFAEICQPQTGGDTPLFAVGEGERCSNLIIGSIRTANGPAPTWATVENHGTINVDETLNNNAAQSAGAISLVTRAATGPDADKKTTITNFGTITGGETNFGISIDAGVGLERLTNNKGGEITGIIALNSIGSIISINNSGLMKGAKAGIYSQNGSIKELQNGASGEITGGLAGIRNLSDIGIINNAGVISSTADKSLAILNDQYTIGEITNSGTITGETADGTIGIGNRDEGVITLLNNLQGGQIIGTASGVTNTATSEITILTNAGTIKGGESGIVNAGKIGTFDNKAEGLIEGTLYGINHSGVIDTLTNEGAIKAENAQNASALFIAAKAKLGTLTNSGAISGTSTGGVGYGVENFGTVTTLTNSGSITGSYAGLNNEGDIVTFKNNTDASITGDVFGVYNSGSIGALNNDGTISAYNTAQDVWGLKIIAGASLNSLVNNKEISGSSAGDNKGYGVENSGAINSFTNLGSIVGSYVGLDNSGSILTFTNNQGASITGGVFGVYNSGTIGALTNDETISAYNTTQNAWGLKVIAGASLNTLVNNKVISGSSAGDNKGYGVENSGAINSLTNRGSIVGSYVGLDNAGSILIFNNNKGASITGEVFGVYDSGSIDALTNAGTINATAPDAPTANATGLQIKRSGSITTLQNDGAITAVNTTSGAYGLNIQELGNIGDLNNTNAISASSTTATATALSLDANANLRTLNNSGTISGLATAGGKGYGVTNDGAITTLNNSKIITGSYAGLSNSGTGSIAILNNNGGASITGAAFGVYDAGTIGALTNAGSINATAPSSPPADAAGLQVASGGSVTRLQNDGSITAVNTTRAAYGVAIEPLASIGELTNAKTISGSATGGGNGYGLANAGAITTLTNSKTITGSYAGVSNTGSISTLSNNADASITGGVIGLYDSGSIGALTNAGAINATAPNNPTADATALLLDTGARIPTLRNDGDISAVNTTRAAFAIAIRTDQIIDSFNNTQTLSATTTSGNATALFLDSAAKIGTLTNAGALTGASSAGGAGIGISNAGTITDLTNKNAISGSTFGISNTGTINTFTNYQGGGGSAAPAQSALTYAGKLPGSYFIHITSSTYYGQVVFTNPTGSMTFGVTQSSTIEKRTYDSVLSNLDTTAITGDRTGTLKGLTWYLERHPGSTTVWDLVFKDPTPPTDPTPSTSTTLVTLNTNAASLRQALNARTTAMAGALDYDCASFDAQGYCLSFQARYSAMDSMSEGAGVLIGAKRLAPQLRLGAFLDYSLARRDPQGLTFGDPQPLIGAFLGYDQDGEGRGLQGKLTAAMNRGAVTVSRASGLADTEPGSGKASLNSYGLAGEIGWGLALDGATMVTPYVGLRHTLARRGAYGERTVAGVVDFPLSYAPFSQSLTTATTGLRLKSQVTDKIGFQLGLGADYDFAQKANAYAGASAIPGLETFALPGAQTSNRFRPVGHVSLLYQIDRTQRLTCHVSVRGQAFSNQMAASVMIGYQVAF